MGLAQERVSENEPQVLPAATRLIGVVVRNLAGGNVVRLDDEKLVDFPGLQIVQACRRLGVNAKLRELREVYRKIGRLHDDADGKRRSACIFGGNRGARSAGGAGGCGGFRRFIAV